MTYYLELVALMEEGTLGCETLLASEHIDVLLDLSRDRKFDVLITEYFNTDCALGLAYKLNISTFIGMVCTTIFLHFVFAFLTEKFRFGGENLVELCIDAVALRPSRPTRYTVLHSQRICRIYIEHELLREINQLDDCEAHQNLEQVGFDFNSSISTKECLGRKSMRDVLN